MEVLNLNSISILFISTIHDNIMFLYTLNNIVNLIYDLKHYSIMYNIDLHKLIQ